MTEAYRLTRKDGAPGIDGVTAADYEANLEGNLLDLLERIKSGRYSCAAGPPGLHPQSGRLAEDARHSDALGIMHLIQFALGILNGDDLSWRPIFASVDRQRRRL
jgi:hypothetical protein